MVNVYLGLSHFLFHLLPCSGYFNSTVVIFLSDIVLIVIDVIDVEELVIDDLVAVVDGLASSIASSVFFIDVNIFGLFYEPGRYLAELHEAIVIVFLHICRNAVSFSFPPVPFLVHPRKFLVLLLT